MNREELIEQLFDCPAEELEETIQFIVIKLHERIKRERDEQQKVVAIANERIALLTNCEKLTTSLLPPQVADNSYDGISGSEVAERLGRLAGY